MVRRKTGATPDFDSGAEGVRQRYAEYPKEVPRPLHAYWTPLIPNELPDGRGWAGSAKCLLSLIVFDHRDRGRGGFSAEQPVKRAADVFFVGLAKDAGNHFAIFVEDHGGGEFVTEAGAVEHVEIAAKPDFHTQRVRGQELVNFGAVFRFIGRDGEETDPLRSIFLLKARKHGQLFAAWSAPGSPEVDDHDGAAQVIDFLRLAGEVFQFEIGHAFSVGTRAEEGKQDECEGKSQAHNDSLPLRFLCIGEEPGLAQLLAKGEGLRSGASSWPARRIAQRQRRRARHRRSQGS